MSVGQRERAARRAAGVRAVPPAAEGRPPAAVIEIGTTSVRMAIAERDADGGVRTLESVQQPVTLGKDAFTRGVIGRDAIEECVGVLRSFRRLLREYHVPEERVRAVATSAVRESANREAVIDRIAVATGLAVDVLDETEANRFTFFAVRLLFPCDPSLRKGNVLVVEVGGGGTQALLFHRGRVVQSHAYRFGSLRVRASQESYGEPVARLRPLILGHVDRCLAQLQADIPLRRNARLLLFGGDARFAATQEVARPTPDSVVTLSAARLREITESILPLSADEIVRRHHVSYPDAETLGPALLFHCRLAERLRARRISVAFSTLREGLLYETLASGSLTPELRGQIVASVAEIGRKYQFDRAHAEQVARLSQRLFHALREEHRLGEADEVLLLVAALLHDVGLFISSRSHHKHSMYLIQNCDIFGLTAHELNLAAVVARYHRKALPSRWHPEYAALDPVSRSRVTKLASILRVADALDRGHVGRVEDPDVAVGDGQLVLTVGRAGDLTLEQGALREKGQMFEQVYGMEPVLRGGGEVSHAR